MNKRSLAYIALLAGWLCFCYWLYVKGIVPLFQQYREKSRTETQAEIPYLLAYTWASATPVTGNAFDSLKARIYELDSLDQVVLIKGYYFRDEAKTFDSLESLASDRIRNAMTILSIPDERCVSEVGLLEIHADVRSNPFEAVRFEILPVTDLVHRNGDTLEVCFPIKDSLVLPPVCLDSVTAWYQSLDTESAENIFIIGTADGTGIVEPMDRAHERALLINDLIVRAGGEKDHIQLSTGQRSNPLTLRNRCVIMYFE